MVNIISVAAWIDSIFVEGEPKRRESEERDRSWLSSVPPSSTSALGARAPVDRIEASYEEWRAVGPTASLRVASQEIWDSNAVGSGRLRNAYESTHYSDSMAVGSGSRTVNRLEDQNSGNNSLDLGIRVPNPDITREVEA